MGLRMLNCDDAPKLISEAMDHELPFWERLSLKIHLATCKVCSGYKRKLQLLRGWVKSWAHGAIRLLADKSLSPESKSRIKLNLREIAS